MTHFSRRYLLSYSFSAKCDKTAHVTLTYCSTEFWLTLNFSFQQDCLVSAPQFTQIAHTFVLSACFMSYLRLKLLVLSVTAELLLLFAFSLLRYAVKQWYCFILCPRIKLKSPIVHISFIFCGDICML